MSYFKLISFLQPVQDKKPPRVRKPRGKQPDPEPVILTLSSDEEDSNSSMLSQVSRKYYLCSLLHHLLSFFNGNQVSHTA